MNNSERFSQAVRVLSPRLTELFLMLEDNEKQTVREIRLRRDKPVVAVTESGISFLHASGRLTNILSSLTVITQGRELEEIFHRICSYSVYACKDAVNRGFVTVEGGHRAGVAGTAVTENGRITAVRDINCINLRIAREIYGAADEIFRRCCSDGFSGLIVAGPPSSGKTTVLRDLARQLSGEERGIYAKVFVCDERGEIGAVHNGKVQNDLGINCDVVTSYPKSEGILIGLRSFSPDIIICDEIATEEEAAAVESGLCSGVQFALSVHAMNKSDLQSKPIVRRMLKTGCFGNTVLLSGNKVGVVENYFMAGDLIGKACGGDSCWDGTGSGGKTYCFEG